MTAGESAKKTISTLPLWEAMTVDEYAEFEKANDMHVVKIDGIWWKRVRTFFYRQLFPFEALTDDPLKRPWTSYLGGTQHIVPSYETANSFLHLRVFDHIQNYSIMSLDKNRRRQVKKGSKIISIKPIRNIKEFQDEGYPVYMSFYDKTRYSYKSERTKQSNFVKWAEVVFNFPKIMILGGYEKDKLCAVCLSYLVEDVIYYDTFFSLTEYRNTHVSDLMLHSVRELAASHSHVRCIYAGMYAGVNGVDDFYFLRGCKLIRQPAFYRVNPVAMFFVRNFMRKEYGKLTGSFNNDGIDSGVAER